MSRVPFTCQHCNQAFSIELPISTTVNEGDYSMTVAKHQVFTCINAKCRQTYRFVLEGAACNWAAEPVQRQPIEDSGLIVPKKGLSLVSG